MSETHITQTILGQGAGRSEEVVARELSEAYNAAARNGGRIVGDHTLSGFSTGISGLAPSECIYITSTIDDDAPEQT